MLTSVDLSPLVFLLVIPRTLTSTLFPYTTLFRSKATKKFIVYPGKERFPVTKEISAIPILDMMKDRKSTRLNSSHEWISYAVVCLEKQNASVSRPMASVHEAVVLQDMTGYVRSSI